jgi:hypothetical protein
VRSAHRLRIKEANVKILDIACQRRDGKMFVAREISDECNKLDITIRIRL